MPLLLIIIASAGLSYSCAQAMLYKYFVNLHHSSNRKYNTCTVFFINVCLPHGLCVKKVVVHMKCDVIDREKNSLQGCKMYSLQSIITISKSILTRTKFYLQKASLRAARIDQSLQRGRPLYIK